MSNKNTLLSDANDQIMALLVLVGEAAQMMGDADGSYGCDHLDNLEDWMDRARPFFFRNDKGAPLEAVTAVMEGRSPRPENEPAALESWKRRLPEPMPTPYRKPAPEPPKVLSSFYEALREVQDAMVKIAACRCRHELISEGPRTHEVTISDDCPVCGNTP